MKNESVSLRERVAKLVFTEYHDKECFCHNCKTARERADQILALFPAQLTEEEVEKILPKKKKFNSQASSVSQSEMDVKIYNQAIDDCKSALIGKCGEVEKCKE